MREQRLTVHCTFCGQGRALREIWEEAFRLYLRRVLASPDGEAGRARDGGPGGL